MTARVATLSQITDLLKKTEQSQRVLDGSERRAGVRMLSTDDGTSDENISIEKLTKADLMTFRRLSWACRYDDFYGAGAARFG